MVLNVSDAEKADIGRMLQTRPWGIIMKHLQDVATSERKNILGGVITPDRLFDLRAKQASLQCINSIVRDVYTAGGLKPPNFFENMLG